MFKLNRSFLEQSFWKRWLPKFGLFLYSVLISMPLCLVIPPINKRPRWRCQWHWDQHLHAQLVFFLFFKVCFSPSPVWWYLPDPIDPVWGYIKNTMNVCVCHQFCFPECDYMCSPVWWYLSDPIGIDWGANCTTTVIFCQLYLEPISLYKYIVCLT